MQHVLEDALVTDVILDGLSILAASKDQRCKKECQQQCALCRLWQHSAEVPCKFFSSSGSLCLAALTHSCLLANTRTARRQRGSQEIEKAHPEEVQE